MYISDPRLLFLPPNIWFFFSLFFQEKYTELAREWTRKYAMWLVIYLGKATWVGKKKQQQPKEKNNTLKKKHNTHTTTIKNERNKKSKRRKAPFENEKSKREKNKIIRTKQQENKIKNQTK